jgi:hypothetical protein
MAVLYFERRDLRLGKALVAKRYDAFPLAASLLLKREAA